MANNGVRQGTYETGEVRQKIFCALFYDTVSISDYIASDGRMTGE
jgi:hypothetical protein